jgi:hypothetical protein
MYDTATILLMALLRKTILVALNRVTFLSMALIVTDFTYKLLYL